MKTEARKKYSEREQKRVRRTRHDGGTNEESLRGNKILQEGESRKIRYGGVKEKTKRDKKGKNEEA